jgi:nucleotide-binding universal stress UspA family protein
MMPFRKILVPTDGNDSTNAAIAYALDLAKFVGAEVTALCVYDMSNYASAPDVLPDADSLLYKASESAVRYVVEQGKAIGVEVRPMIVNGIPPKYIVESSKDYDLIVMGTVGRTGLSHLLLGSVAGKVIRFSSCPVLVVNGAFSAKKGGVNCRRLLIPTDGSKDTEAAMRLGLELAKIFGSAVTAMSVTDINALPISAKEFEKNGRCLHETPHMAVDHVVEEGRKIGVEVMTTIAAGSPSNEIVNASGVQDLIVMGTAGRTGLDYMKLGSVAEKTVRNAKCPVLVVRASIDVNPK